MSPKFVEKIQTAEYKELCRQESKRTNRYYLVVDSNGVAHRILKADSKED